MYTLLSLLKADNWSIIYVSGKNNKILPIPETMQGISIIVESKEERNKVNNSCSTHPMSYHLCNKRACPTKNEPQQGISYLKREREGYEIKRRAGRRVSRQAYLRVMLGLKEIEREKDCRDEESERDRW